MLKARSQRCDFSECDCIFFIKSQSYAINTPSGSVSSTLKFWRLGWRLGMDLGPIFKCHNVFQWELTVATAAWCTAWCSVCLYPYSVNSIIDMHATHSMRCMKTHSHWEKIALCECPLIIHYFPINVGDVWWFSPESIELPIKSWTLLERNLTSLTKTSDWVKFLRLVKQKSLLLECTQKSLTLFFGQTMKFWETKSKPRQCNSFSEVKQFAKDDLACEFQIESLWKSEDDRFFTWQGNLLH